MEVLTSLNGLRAALPQPEGAETSYAAVFVDGAMGTEHLAATAEAARVCDVAVVFSFVELSATALKALKQEGADVVAHLAEEPDPPIQADYQGKNCTKLLQSLLALLPSVVVVAQVDLAFIAKLQAVLSTFPDLFLLQKTPVKVAYLSAEMAAVRQEIAGLSVKAEKELIKDVFDVLNLHKITKVETVRFLSAPNLAELANVPLNQKFYVYFQGVQNGKRVKDLVPLAPSLLKRII